MFNCDLSNRDLICLIIYFALIAVLVGILIGSIVSLPEYRYHAIDCQCHECVVYKCNQIKHGDSCQCDKCLECKNIGGN